MTSSTITRYLLLYHSFPKRSSPDATGIIKLPGRKYDTLKTYVRDFQNCKHGILDGEIPFLTKASLNYLAEKIHIRNKILAPMESTRVLCLLQVGTSISSLLFSIIPVCKYTLMVSAPASSLPENEPKGLCSASRLDPPMHPLCPCQGCAWPPHSLTGAASET